MELYYDKREWIASCIAAVILGTVLHFLYGWWPNAVTALFSPINESIWEHVKLVVWPYLLLSGWLNRGRPGGMRPWLLILPILCLVLLAVGYGYHVVLGGEALWVDIALYLAIMFLGFWLPTRFSGPFQGVLWVLPILATGLLIGLIALFTLYPPHALLFADLSVAGAWMPLPC
jgi:hypothetical protein